jgi:hypothetical protein
VNAGSDLKKALEHARANAARSGTPRVLHVWGDVHWISKFPLVPRPPYTIVFPDGKTEEIKA